MVTAPKILFAQRWKDLTTMEKWMVKMMELAKKAKLIAVIRVKTRSNIDWKQFDFLHDIKKMKL